MRRRRHLIAAAAALSIGAACGPKNDASWKQSLSPGPNPFSQDDPLYGPQPTRDHPYALALSADGAKLYVALQGVEDDPRSEVAVIDTASAQAVRRIRVGSSPSGLALHPGGRFLVVTNRYSNFASVIDTRSDEVVLDVPVPFYTIEAAFTPDGSRAYLTNRWKDSVLRWDLDVGDAFRVTGDDYTGTTPDAPMGIPVGDNPRDLAVSADGSRVYVANLTGLSLSILDTSTDTEARRVDFNSPPGDVALSSPWVFVTHLGPGTGHLPDQGYDTNGDGKPGDGTANVIFQDLQNEIAVLDRDGNLVHDYTTDVICCRDFRDVDPDHPEKGAALPPPDTWPASRLAFLPPKDTWIVAGALPERMAVAGEELLVAFSGSNEVQGFRIAADGSLAPLQRAGGLYRTSMNPIEIVASADGRRAWTADRLGESVTALDLDAGPGHEQRIVVGDVSGGDFPATDAEIGEAINFVTSPLTVDGRQTCVHCHREGDNVARLTAMPLQINRVWGARMVMAYRGAEDTRPWFFETAMNETNFFPVINEFARKENYCCEELDPLVWRAYPSLDQCSASPSTVGCHHVLHCEDDPPPECAARTYGSPHLTRNDAFLAGSRALVGRDHTFGDALHIDVIGPDGGTTRKGVALDFDGVTRSLGLFLLVHPRLLPNPNATLGLAAAKRGQAIYQSPSVGCNTCHPLPLTTVTLDFNPSGVPLRFPAVVTPRLDDKGQNVDTVSAGFIQSFPETRQDGGGVRFGVAQLRGVWDRASMFLHDGRAHSLREVLATPGHPALQPGETGFNETHGMPGTHGSTAELTPEQLDDLVAFLLTL